MVQDPSPEHAVDGEGASALKANEEAKAEEAETERLLLHLVSVVSSSSRSVEEEEEALLQQYQEQPLVAQILLPGDGRLHRSP